MRIPLQLLAVWLVVMSACSPQADERPGAIVQGPLGEKLEQRFEPYVLTVLADHRVESSVAIGVSKGDSIVYAKAFGYQNVETKQPATINTVYHTASLSKPVVATAIVKLMEAGKLQLDDPIVKHLPYFSMQGEGAETMTIRHILTHTSGISHNIVPDSWGNPDMEEGAVERYVRNAASASINFVPGSAYSYSNAGFNILGAVIAKVSGMSFEDYLQAHVLDASGMTSSTFSMPDPLPDNWATPHLFAITTEVQDYYPFNWVQQPSSSLHSSVVDMLQWGRITLNKGTYAGYTVLPASAYDDYLLHPWFEPPWDNAHIGLSWYLQEYKGMKNIMHTGADPGFSAQLILYPEEELSIVVLANRSDSRTARIVNAVVEVLYDHEFYDGYDVSGRYQFGEVMEKEGIEAAKVLWKALEQDTTDIYYTGEWQINTVGHGLIAAKKYEQAKAVFQFNIDEYPESPNVYDSYGDALLAEGDTANAVRYFQQALAVDPEFPDPGPKLARILNQE